MLQQWGKIETISFLSLYYGKVHLEPPVMDILEKITVIFLIKVFIRRMESCELVASSNNIKINNLGEVCCHMLAGMCISHPLHQLLIESCGATGQDDL